MPRVVALVRDLRGQTRCVDVILRDDAVEDDDAALRDACEALDPTLVPPGARVEFVARRRRSSRSAATNALAEVRVRVLGGKGGFGTQLRTAGRRGVQTTNFDACRDLSGRRLAVVNGERKLAEWEAKREEREREQEAEKFLRSRASGSGAAKLRELEEKEREAYQAERARVSESVSAAVASGIKEAAALEELKRKKTAKGKELMNDSDDDDSDEDFDDSALFSVVAKKRPKIEPPADPIATVEVSTRAENDVVETQPEPSTTEPVDQAASEELKPLNLTDYASAGELEAFGLDRLKRELMDRGLKCGGTLTERAARLFLLRDKTRDELDKKFWAK